MTVAQLVGRERSRLGLAILARGVWVALAIATLMQHLRLGVAGRSAVLVPWLVPNVTVAIVTLFVLDPNVGFVNHVVELLGGAAGVAGT